MFAFRKKEDPKEGAGRSENAPQIASQKTEPTGKTDAFAGLGVPRAERKKSREAKAQESSLNLANKEEKTDVLSASWRLNRIVFKEHPYLSLTKVATIVTTTASNFGFLWCSGKIVDAITTQPSQALTYFVAMVAVGVTGSIAGLASKYVDSALAQKTARIFQEKFNRALAGYDLETIESAKFRQDVTKYRENSYRMNNFTGRTYSIGGVGLEFLTAGLVLSQVNPLVGLCVMAAAVPKVIVERKHARAVEGLENEIADDRRKFWYGSYYASEDKFLKELKLYQKTQQLITKVSGLSESFINKDLKIWAKNLVRHAGSTLVDNAVTYGAVGYFLHQAVTGSITAGSFTFLVGAIYRFSMAVQNICSQAGGHMQDYPFVKLGLQLMDRSPEKNKKNSYTEIDWSKPPKIELDNITFTYPGAAKPTLKDFSLTIKPGEYLGIVGGSGNGKTTLVKILTGIYQTTSGSVRLNDVPIEDIDPDQLLANLSVMTQDSPAFESFSIAETVRLGEKGPASEDAFTRALKESGIDCEIAELPNGRDTIVGTGFENGQDFSTGQKQRIALARSLIRQPNILILDEPTSNLDVHSEERITESLATGHSEDVTRIIISHRYGTLRKADRIIMIADGRIVESGSHQELLALNGQYAASFRKQAAQYE